MKMFPLLEELILIEMSQKEIVDLGARLTQLYLHNGIRFKFTKHGAKDRLYMDLTRQDIEPEDFYRTMAKLLEHPKFQKMQKERAIYEGLVTNHNTSLNIVFGVTRNEVRIMTAKMGEFHADNKPTVKFGVRV